MNNEDRITMIKVSVGTAKKIKEYRLTNRESYDEILNRFLIILRKERDEIKNRKEIQVLN